MREDVVEYVYRGMPHGYPDVYGILRQVEGLREEWLTANKRASSLTDALEAVVELSMERHTTALDFAIDEIREKLEITKEAMNRLSVEMYSLEGVLEDALWASEEQ